jgi:hypothetical protein
MLIDLKFIETDAKIYKYADDQMVVFRLTNNISENPEMSNAFRLNKLLNELFDYYTDNRLTLNREKSYFMCLGNAEMRDVKYMLRCAGFKNETELTYLGITIDTNLKMNLYAESIVKKMRQATGALWHLKDQVPLDALKKFYFGHVHSHLMFCSFVLTRCNKLDIKRIQTLQNRALKIVFKLPHLTPTTEVFDKHATNVLPVRGIIYYSIIIMIKKNLIINSPERLPIERVRSNRNYNLRSHRYNSRAMRNDICCAGIEIFNNLPTNIKEIDQLVHFKSAVKSFLLAHTTELLNNDNFLQNIS